MTGRGVRTAALAVLAVDVAAVLVTFTVAAARPDSEPIPARIVESRCIDGAITQGIDDGNPAGVLAYDTGATC